MQQDFGHLRDLRYQWTLSVVTGCFFVLFLLVFLPFGVNNYDPNHRYSPAFLLGMGLFGLSTSLVLLANEYLLAPRLPEPRSWLEVALWWAWLALCVGSVNFLIYNWLGHWHDLHLLSWLAFLGNCASVLVFPLLGCHLHFRHRSLRQRFAAELERHRGLVEPGRMLSLGAPGASDRIELRVGDFLSAQAQDNYVELRYLAGGQRRSHLLRATLAGVAEAAAETGIVRCHRSHLVNLRRVVAVRGSGQRLQLILDADGVGVPVSRGFAEDTLAALRALGLEPVPAEN